MDNVVCSWDTLYSVHGGIWVNQIRESGYNGEVNGILNGCKGGVGGVMEMNGDHGDEGVVAVCEIHYYCLHHHLGSFDKRSCLILFYLVWHSVGDAKKPLIDSSD